MAKGISVQTRGKSSRARDLGRKARFRMASEMGKSYETVKGTHKAKPITMASDAEQKIRGAVAFGARADARVGGFDAKATGGGGVPNGRRRLWRAAEVTPGWHTGPVEPAQGGSSIRVGGEGAAITSCVGSTLRDAQQVEGLGRTVGTMGRCVEKAGSRDQRHGVSPAEGEAAAAVERLRRRLEIHAGKLHVLTPTQANGQLLEAIAVASAGLGMAAQRLAAYEAAEVNCVQREGPKQGGAGVAELAEAEEVAEEAKKLGDQLG